MAGSDDEMEAEVAREMAKAVRQAAKHAGARWIQLTEDQARILGRAGVSVTEARAVSIFALDRFIRGS